MAINVEDNRTYYTGKGVTGYTNNGKLIRVEITEARTMEELVKRSQASAELHKKLHEDGIS